MRRSLLLVGSIFAVACAGGDSTSENLGGGTGGSGTGAAAGKGGASAGAAGAAAGGAAGTSTAGSSGAGGGSGSGGDSGSGGSSGGSSGSSGSGGGSSGSSGSGGGSSGSSGSGGGSGGSGTAGTGGSGPTNPPTITVGAPNHILLLGTVVTPDMAFAGAVLVVDDKIACVQAGDACMNAPEAAGATIIQTNGVISPGLIDTHNHILFDIFDDDDWLPLKSYMDHTQWTTEQRYGVMLDVKQCLEDASQGKPTWCPAKYNSTGNLKCEMDKWGELKGMISGTTAIVGLPGTSGACFGSLSRSIDVTQNDLGVDTVQTSAIFPPSAASATSTCANFASNKTKAYLIHVGEGIDPKAKAEFTTLSNLGTPAGCLLAPQTAITHGTSFGAAEFMTMAMAGMKLTWSPKSNVALYGATADIPAAVAAGLTISLAPDWSMGGSVNLLDEMRFADGWDNAHFGDILKAKDVLAMTTVNAAKVLGYEDRIGSLTVGYLADLFVVPGDGSAPYDQILAARPRDVRLVMVGGKVLYGDSVLKAAGPAMPGCEDLDVCGASKFVCVAEAATTDKLDQTYSTIKQTLEDAMTDVDGITDAAKFDYKFAPLAPLTKCN